MNHPLCQKLKKDPLLTYLRKSGKISPVRFESEALQAVRQNNAAKVALAEKVPTKGGNVTQYTTIIGSEKQALCEEYTMCQYEGSSALELIGIQMLEDWNRKGDLSGQTPVLNSEVSRVGISNKPHPITKNLIQILYVKSTANVLA